MPVLYAIVVLLLSINILLAFPRAVDLVQTSVVAADLPNISNIPIKSKIDPYPKNLGLPLAPISAAASVVVDWESNRLLFAKNSQKRVPIASTTKIMTALVAIEVFRPDDVLLVPEIIGVDGSTMNLQVGEKITFRSILYGLLLNSGNDAAYTIAANFPGGVQAFVAAMNKKANNLGLDNTHFDNPAGFDSPEHYSSAADLAEIARVAAEDYQLARIFATKETLVASIDKNITHPLKNLNKLLSQPGVMGIKTGTTPAAKENLVGLVDRNGHKILTVVLGSNDRFGETEKLINWTYSNYIWP